MSSPVSLIGKVAVVTGASDGIGKAIALTLAGQGVRVALGARRKELLDAVVSEIRFKGGEAIAVKTDVVDRQQVKNLVAKAEESFGPVDILVNNAGIFYLTMMKSVKEDDWERMIDVNCKGLMNGIGAVLTGMLQRGSGHIVNISSDSGRESTYGMAVYSGTKFFVEGMTQSFRKEIAGSGVRITNVQPGYVKTPGVDAITNLEPEAKPALGESYGEMDMLQGEDIANCVVYALTQPKHVGINEILVQPSNQK